VEGDRHDLLVVSTMPPAEAAPRGVQELRALRWSAGDRGRV